MKKIKVKDNEDLVRDSESNAVLNVNLSALEAYKKRRDQELQKDKELSSLREEVTELKEMVKQFLTEKSK
jgi:hypothetical protein